MRKLNILNLATTDQGGAGIAALYFNELFNREGHNSILLVKESELKNKNVIVLKRDTSFSLNRNLSRLLYVWKRLKNIMYKGGLFDSKYFFFNEDESKQYISSNKILNIISFKPDVIVLHWVSNFINSKTINELALTTKAKIVWLMMDNAPFTGGCHYPWNCIGFKSDCSDCPAINEDSKKNIAYKNLKFKKNNLPESLIIFACSELDYVRAKSSSLFENNNIQKILLSVDGNKYMPANKVLSKQYFGINSDSKVILYGASSLKNIRKGGLYFLEALSILQIELKKKGYPLDKLIIIVTGNCNRELFNNFEIPIMCTGFLSEENLIKAYQAADVFVSTSIEDSGPLMINQSIMCGTPVVSFAMGVSLDLVITGETGYSAKLKDSADLANGIKYLLELNGREYIKMCKNCRQLCLILCNSQKQVKKIIEILNVNLENDKN